ncbi:fructokinase [Xanthomonas arboricola]|uniref:PfkB family carbohydrate kinase n=1 Tax=Xanthomonas arboricola TaxID=56448 RepID=UPI0016140CEB|nr:fructokinase [Xanthomonas arboricola]
MPRILGLGLVALDLIVEHYETHRQVLLGGGGTCANVLAILARAGWKADLAGALDNSAWSELMRKDLQGAGVETTGVRTQAGAAPSLIVEHLARSGAAKGKHWFQVYGAKSGQDWPGLHAAPDCAVRSAISALRDQDVLFVDRLSDAVLELAHQAKARNVVVVYEPSSRTDRPWVSEMLVLADVVKYSSERADALGVKPAEIDANLTMVTDGPRGAAWRLGGVKGQWQHQPAIYSEGVVDTCGAGDWYTAGLLMGLCGKRPHRNAAMLTPERVAHAAEGASMLAAWSCGYVGARGALYDAHVADFKAKISSLYQANPSLHGRLPRPNVPAAYRQEVSSLYRS